MACRPATTLLLLLLTIALGCGHAPAKTPTATDASTELLAAEQAVFTALQHRDRAALSGLVATDFVLRMPGDPDVRKAEFVDANAHMPGEILAVEGAELSARTLAPDLGIVSGLQLMRVRIDGKEVAGRGAFSDVFRREPDGRWRLVFAYAVSLP